MARRLWSNQDIDAYVNKISIEATHHAPNVDKVVLSLSSEVRARLNLQVDKVEVYERDGNLARTCWVTIDGKRYAFSYNYGVGKIDLRSKSTQGALICQFDNNTTVHDLKFIISNM